MATERIYQQVRGETGLTDVKITVYNSAGTAEVTSQDMTEVGSTGIYYYDFTYTSAGNYTAVVSSSSLGFQATQTVSIAMSYPVGEIGYLDIKADIGEAYNQVGGINNNLGTTSAILQRLIARAETDVTDVTGTTTGYNQPIRYLADAYALTHCLSSLGPESDNETKILNMRNNFIELAKTAFRRKGKDYDNIAPAWVHIND